MRRARRAALTDLFAGRRRLSVIARLGIAHTVVVTIALAILIPLLHIVLKNRLVSEVDRAVRAAADEALRGRPSGGQPAAERAVDFTLERQQLGRYALTVVGELGKPGTWVGVSDGAGDLITSPQLRALLDDPPQRAKTLTLKIAGIPMRVLVEPLTDSTGVFVITEDISRIENTVKMVDMYVVIAGVLGGTFGTYLTYRSLRRLMHGVRRIRQAALEINESDLRQRIGDDSHDEIGQLSQTFDAMFDRLESAFDGQRRLLSEVSHQLRTPLTVIRGHLDVQLRAGVEDTDEVETTLRTAINEVDHMTHLVGQLLDLGKSLEGAETREEPIELGGLLDEVYTAATVLADRRWGLEAPPRPIVLLGDRQALRGALLNLVDNAIKATRQGDAIVLSATIGDEFRLTISDTGRGMRVTDVAAVTGRYVRGTASYQEGHGLGLAIVRAVAESHRGRVEVTSREGLGSRISLCLPRTRVVAHGRVGDDGSLRGAEFVGS